VQFGILFVVLAFVLVLFLWGGSMLLQGWLYQNPADRMPIRALVGGTVLAGFLTIWCAIDARDGGKYDTLFEFSAVESTEVDAFDTVMQSASGQETIIAYHRRAGTNDFIDDKQQPWKKNTSDTMAVAILINDPDKPEPTRFNANLEITKNPDGSTRSTFPRDRGELRFTDANGRYMPADAPGHLFRKKTGVLFANLFLNFFHLALWWMVLWLCMRFMLWHALGLAFVLWMLMMVAIQPMLFHQTRPAQTKTSARALPAYASSVVQASDTTGGWPCSSRRQLTKAQAS
jgi:hypothetical protein